MAWTGGTPTLHQAGQSGTNGSSFLTASRTPTANYLQLLAVHAAPEVTSPTVPTVTGGGLTWVQVATVSFSTIAAPERTCTLFRALGASPSAGQLTIDFAGQTQNSCAWNWTEWPGIDIGGSNGANAIVQSATNRNNNAAALTVTLAAFASANNATAGFFAIAGNDATQTEGSGFTILGNSVVTTTPLTRMTGEYLLDTDTTVDLTNSAARAVAGIAVEIKAVVASGCGSTAKRQSLARRFGMF